MTTIAFLVSEITKAIFLVENNICKQDKAIAYSCVHRSWCAGCQWHNNPKTCTYIQILSKKWNYNNHTFHNQNFYTHKF